MGKSKFGQLENGLGLKIAMLLLWHKIQCLAVVYKSWKSSASFKKGKERRFLVSSSAETEKV